MKTNANVLNVVTVAAETLLPLEGAGLSSVPLQLFSTSCLTLPVSCYMFRIYHQLKLCLFFFTVFFWSALNFGLDCSTLPPLVSSGTATCGPSSISFQDTKQRFTHSQRLSSGLIFTFFRYTLRITIFFVISAGNCSHLRFWQRATNPTSGFRSPGRNQTLGENQPKDHDLHQKHLEAARRLSIEPPLSVPSLPA